jgi:hypothetical protein
MNDKEQMIVEDLLQGMKSRACYKFDDTSACSRNDSWYAKKMYGDVYTGIRSAYVDERIEDDRKP